MKPSENELISESLTNISFVIFCFKSAWWVLSVRVSYLIFFLKSEIFRLSHFTFVLPCSQIFLISRANNAVSSFSLHYFFLWTFNISLFCRDVPYSTARQNWVQENSRKFFFFFLFPHLCGRLLEPLHSQQQINKLVF